MLPRTWQFLLAAEVGRSWGINTFVQILFTEDGRGEYSNRRSLSMK